MEGSGGSTWLPARESKSGQAKLYVILEGEATLRLDWRDRPGTGYEPMSWA